MAKSKIQQTIRKSAEGTLDFSNGNVQMEVEGIGSINFTDIFNKFDGEHVKVVVTVSNDGDDSSDINEDNEDNNIYSDDSSDNYTTG